MSSAVSVPLESATPKDNLPNKVIVVGSVVTNIGIAIEESVANIRVSSGAGAEAVAVMVRVGMTPRSASSINIRL